MKQLSLLILLFLGSLQAQADDFSYLTFQTQDGSLQSVSLSSLQISIADGKLTATTSDGSHTFTLTDLQKMYFSTTSLTGIEELQADANAGEGEWFTLGGVRIQKPQKAGIYIVKSNGVARKVTIK